MRIHLEPWFHPGEKEAVTDASFSVNQGWLRIEGVGCLTIILNEDEIDEMEKALTARIDVERK